MLPPFEVDQSCRAPDVLAKENGRASNSGRRCRGDFVDQTDGKARKNRAIVLL
jgi:hypothetical protein